MPRRLARPTPAVAALALLGAITLPAGVADARKAPACIVPTGELVPFDHGKALVTSNAIVTKSTRTVTYYACLRGVGKSIVIDRTKSVVSKSPTGGTAVAPENFVIAGNYLSFVQVSSSGATTVDRMAVEQWNIRTGKRTLNPNRVPGVTYATVATPPRFTASTRGYLAWVITIGLPADPTDLGAVDTVTDVVAFDGHGAAVDDTFNSQTDTAPAGTPLSGIFTGLAIDGAVLSWDRLGQPKTAPIG
ncbi:MAG TPA: hypothetical protein VHW26_09395 [Solirubrobacteraceae bacterium]|jgi:hypothetical protein|nr:hypothetical protein [Solirubrobacteraceae bacterium]